jgi:hypothetical protein
MAGTAATTSRFATAPTDLVAALAALQACVAEAEAQQARAVAAVLGAVAPPPRPATTAAPVAAPGQATPAVGAFETSSVGYIHAQAVGIQDIRTSVPVVLDITST